VRYAARATKNPALQSLIVGSLMRAIVAHRFRRASKALTRTFPVRSSIHAVIQGSFKTTAPSRMQVTFFDTFISPLTMK
jgi:hypothetical protein